MMKVRNVRLNNTKIMLTPRRATNRSMLHIAGRKSQIAHSAICDLRHGLFFTGLTWCRGLGRLCLPKSFFFLADCGDTQRVPGRRSGREDKTLGGAPRGRRALQTSRSEATAQVLFFRTMIS